MKICNLHNVSVRSKKALVRHTAAAPFCVLPRSTTDFRALNFATAPFDAMYAMAYDSTIIPILYPPRGLTIMENNKTTIFHPKEVLVAKTVKAVLVLSSVAIAAIFASRERNRSYR